MYVSVFGDKLFRKKNHDGVQLGSTVCNWGRGGGVVG